jgi:hypothetical protein
MYTYIIFIAESRPYRLVEKTCKMASSKTSTPGTWWWSAFSDIFIDGLFIGLRDQ